MTGNPTGPWTIIADDLTGAADAAASYGRTHSSTVVLDFAGPWPDAEILAVNTESRYLADADAAAAVAYCVGRSLELHRRVFKKIDSLLRGNPGVEVAAALAALGKGAIALVAPAFPATGRQTVGGVVQVDGGAHDGGHFGGSVVKALAPGGLAAVTVPLVPGRTAADLAEQLGGLQRQGVRAVVLDAESDQDLECVVRAARLLPGPALLVGSGGLAGHITLRRDAVAPSAAGFRAAARALVVIGSYSALARAQLASLVESGLRHVTLDHGSLREAGVPAGLAEILAAGDVVLTPDPAAALDKAQAQLVARCLAAATLSVMDGCDVLVVTGGETARAILDDLGARHMTVLGEVEPGVVINELPGTGPLLVTKAAPSATRTPWSA